MKRKVAYIGFGDLGRQLSVYLRQQNNEEFSEIYFDDNLAAEKKPFAFAFTAYSETRFSDVEFFVCLGYHHLSLKTKIIDDLISAGRKPGRFIHHSAIVNPSAKIGDGVVIYPGCVVDQDVILENGVLLNNSVTISHNSEIGKSTFIAPGAVICGHVKIGQENFIGSGTLVANNIETGNNIICGIGTVVTGNIPANSSVIGNPMTILSKKIQIR